MADLLGSLTAAGETASLVLVTLAFVLFLGLALRSRSYRSLQFQMLLVTFVLFVAEVPKILSTLGMLNVSDYEVVGLEVHSVSMVLLSGFLAWRVYRFLKGS